LSEQIKGRAVAHAGYSVAAVARRLPFVSRMQSLVGLAAVLLIAVVASPHSSQGGLLFLEPGNITDILRQVSEIGIISLGMTFVILTGGIDLSVGTVLAISSSIVALILTGATLPIPRGAVVPAAVLCAVAVSFFVGLINGVAVARLRIQPFIATLATMIGVRGLARWLTSNSNVDIGFGSDLASVFARTLSSKAMVIGSYVLLSVALGALLSRTVFGRQVRAVGDNEKAALYAGLPIKKIKIMVYTLAGGLAGYSGVLHAAQNHQGNPNTGVAYELEAIAAVVIGGTSLMGGRGSIGGTVIGSLIIGILTNVLRLNNVDANVEMMVKAVIILGAVWLQQAGRKES
jgi:ribose transport system permease protein